MGKVVVLSGGSRGLGLHIVEHLLSKDCTICTFARSHTHDVVRLEKAHQDSFMFRALDSRDVEGIKQYIQDIVDRFGRIDGLVNNAAVGQDHLLLHMAEDIVKDIIDINLFSPIMLSKEVAKQMMQKKLESKDTKLMRVITKHSSKRL